MADDEDKLVTKPFKFVTGKYSLLRSLDAVYAEVHGSWLAPTAPFLQEAYLKRSCLRPLPRTPLTDVLHLGFDARFPNQNQSVYKQFLHLRSMLICLTEPSTAGKIMSTTTNASWQKAKTSLHAVR